MSDTRLGGNSPFRVRLFLGEDSSLATLPPSSSIDTFAVEEELRQMTLTELQTVATHLGIVTEKDDVRSKTQDNVLRLRILRFLQQR